MLSRGPRPANMRGWGWSRVSHNDNGGVITDVYEVTRAPGAGSVKGLRLQFVVRPAQDGSEVILDWGSGGRQSGVMFGLGSIVNKEATLLRSQLQAG